MKFKALSMAALAASAVLFSGLALSQGYYVGYQKSDMERTVYGTPASKADRESKQIVLGKQAGENFSVELMYGSNDDTDKSYYGVLIRPQTKLNSFLDASLVLGKFGGEFFEGSDDFSWGFGFEFRPSNVLSVTADWIHYSEIDTATASVRLTGLNLGIKFRFGASEED